MSDVLDEEVEKLRRAGRPSDYSLEVTTELCNRIAQGKSLRKVCEASDMPAVGTVFRWLAEHVEFQEQYARAKEESADADQEKLEDIGDEAIEEAKKADPKAAGAIVNAYKLKADVIKWAMSKKKPKKYGDKLDLTSGGAALPTPIYGGRSTNTENTGHNVDEENLPAA